MDIARTGNKYLADTEPWKLIKTDEARVKTIINLSLQLCANLAIAFEPFTPFMAASLRLQLGLGSLGSDSLGNYPPLPAGPEIAKPELLY